MHKVQYLAKYSVKKRFTRNFIIIIIIFPSLDGHVITTLSHNHYNTLCSSLVITNTNRNAKCLPTTIAARINAVQSLMVSSNQTNEIY